MELQDKSSQDDYFIIFDLIATLIEKRWVMFWAVVLSGLIGLFICSSQVPIYTAVSHFIPQGALGEQSELDSLTKDKGYNWQTVRSGREIADYYTAMFTASPALKRLLQAHFVSEKGDFVSLCAIDVKNDSLSEREQEENLKRRINVSARSSKIFTLSYTSTDPTVSAQVVNFIVDDYTSQTVMDIKSSPAERLVTKRLEDVKADLDEVQKNLAFEESKFLDRGQKEREQRVSFLEIQEKTLLTQYENLTSVLDSIAIRIVIESQSAGIINVIERALPPTRKSNVAKSKILLVSVLLGGFLITLLIIAHEKTLLYMAAHNSPTSRKYLIRVIRDIVIMLGLSLLFLLGAYLIIGWNTT